MAAGPSPKARTPRSKLARYTAVLGLVLLVVSATLAVPLRNYLDRRADQAAAVAQQQDLAHQVEVLKDQKVALQDPDYIRAEARRRLQYVSPGETVYRVVAPAPKPEAAKAGEAPTPETDQWYSRMWSTLTDKSAAQTGER